MVTKHPKPPKWAPTVRKLAKQCGSQADLARTLQESRHRKFDSYFSPPKISRWLTGEVKMSMEDAILINKVFGIPSGKFFPELIAANKTKGKPRKSA